MPFCVHLQCFLFMGMNWGKGAPGELCNFALNDAHKPAVLLRRRSLLQDVLRGQCFVFLTEISK